jgi:branched-chain amino acid transport system substrate-binding protein
VIIISNILKSRQAITRTTAAIILVAIVIVASVGAGFYYFYAAPAPIKEVNIAVLLPMTGKFATLAQLNWEAYQVARDIVNDAGGIKSLGGANISYSLVDTQSDPTIGTSEVERVISLEGFKILSGSYSSSLAYPMTEVAARHDCIYYETSATTDKLTQRNFTNVLRGVITASDFAKIPIPFFDQLDPQRTARIAIVNENSEYGSTMADTWETGLRALGFNIVAHEKYGSDAVDLSSVILRIKAANPDWLLGCQYTLDGILFLRQMKELDLSPKLYMGTTQVTDPYFRQIMGNDTEYVMCDAYYNWDMNIPSAMNLTWPVTVNEFRQRILTKYGHEAVTHHAYVFTSIMALFEGIEKAGSLDPKAIREAMLKIESKYSVCSYGIKFDPQTGQNIWAVNGTVTQFQNGKLRTVWPKDYASATLIYPMPAWSQR